MFNLIKNLFIEVEPTPAEIAERNKKKKEKLTKEIRIKKVNNVRDEFIKFRDKNWGITDTFTVYDYTLELASKDIVEEALNYFKKDGWDFDYTLHESFLDCKSYWSIKVSEK